MAWVYNQSPKAVDAIRTRGPNLGKVVLYPTELRPQNNMFKKAYHIVALNYFAILSREQYFLLSIVSLSSSGWIEVVPKEIKR